MMNWVVVEELVNSTLKPETAAATSGIKPSVSMIGFKIIPPPIPKTPAPTPETYAKPINETSFFPDYLKLLASSGFSP